MLPEDNDNKIRLAVIVALISAVVAVIRLLTHVEFAGTALVYLGIPFSVGMILLFFTREGNAGTTWYMRYWNVLRNSLIVLFLSSIALFEGFICVLMFLPIYFVGIAAAFVVEGLWRAVRRGKNGRNLVSVLPLLVYVFALEGTSSELSFERYNEVILTRVVDQSVAQIRENLVAAERLRSPATGFMRLFPPPVLFEAKSLAANQIHTLDYTYNRWFFTNTHTGRLTVRLTDVDAHGIRTEVLEDTSYLATYLKLHGTRMDFVPVDDETTHVTLSISFDRLLDPAWYFGPLERYGVRAMGEAILDQMVAAKP